MRRVVVLAALIVSSALGVAAAGLPRLTSTPTSNVPASADASAVDDSITSTISGFLATYGSHSYWVANVGNGVETTIAAAPNGAAWTSTGSEVVATTNGGHSWTTRSLPDLVLPNEGDIVVAPNGDVLVAWLDLGNEQSAHMFVSTDGGTTFASKVASGPQPFPDRPWVFVSGPSPVPTLPTSPNPYLAITVAGDSGDSIDETHPVWASGDRGNTWFLPFAQVPTAAASLLPVAVPLAPDAFLDLARPMAQGIWEETPQGQLQSVVGHSGTRFVALSGGAVLDAQNHQWTTDFATWHAVPSESTWPSFAAYPWWDASSDGKIFASQIVQVGGTWTIKYQWYDGTWHPGAVSMALGAKPVYAGGLLGPPLEPDHAALAMKSHGGLLAFNTREGTQDVLIRVSAATSGSPTVTKESIGWGSGARYDFPNLVFDTQGRAVTSFASTFAAYATSA